MNMVFKAVVLVFSICSLSPLFGKTAVPAAQKPANEFIWTDMVQTFHVNGVGSSIRLGFSPDGDKIIANSFNGGPIISLTGEKIKYFSTSTSAYKSAISPDGSKMLSSDYDGDKLMVTVVDIASGVRLNLIDPEVPTEEAIVDTLFSPDGRYVAIIASAQTCILLDLVYSTAKKLPGASPSLDRGVAFSPDSKYFIVPGEHSGTLWDTERGALVKSIPSVTTYAAFLPDNTRILAGKGYVYGLIILDIESGKELKTYSYTDFTNNALAVSPDGKLAAVAKSNGGIALIDVESGAMLRQIKTDITINYLAFSPDSSMLAGSGKDSVVRVWRGLNNGAGSLSEAVASAFKVAVKEPSVPSRLEQGKYESKAAFEARVSKVKSDYEKQVADYNRKIQAGPSKDVFARAFYTFYGSPEINTVSYNPENAMFTFSVVPEKKSGAETPSYTFSLSEPVLNTAAEAFEQGLKKASPKVVFNFSKNEIKLVSASVVVNGRTYKVVPSGETEETERQTVDLSGLSASTVSPSQIDVTMASDDPELAEKAARLAKLRREKEKADRKAKLEAEIATLNSEGVKSFDSDIESPGFKESERAGDYALVVGVEAYKGKDIPKAEFAERDAKTVKAYLVALGVPERNIKLLEGSDATNATLKNYLEEWLPKNVKAGGRVYFYFSGHGAPDVKNGSPYLMPWDGDPAFLKTSAYPLEHVYASLSKLPAKEIIVATDACFSGTGGRSVIQKGLKPLVAVNAGGDIPSNITLFAAAANDEPTGGLDDMGHGMFTYYFLKGLSGGNRDSSRLCEYISPMVRDAAARQNRTQTPVCKGPAIRF